MKCPKCNMENDDSAKFCKYCGTPIKEKTLSHSSVIGPKDKDQTNSKNDNTAKIIIIALIIVIVILAGAFAYLAMANNSNSHDVQDDNSNQVSDNTNDNSQQNSTNDNNNEPTTRSTQASQPSSPSITINGGSFTTGSADADHTYADINLGRSNAGRSVVVQIWYSRDGNTLNDGNMVPVTVESDGYVHLTSADAYKYYPDHATINVYDSNNNLKDTLSVSLSPTDGTQYF